MEFESSLLIDEMISSEVISRHLKVSGVINFGLAIGTTEVN